MASIQEPSLRREAVAGWLKYGGYKYDDMVLFRGIEESLLPRIKSFNFTKDDIVVCTYPRSGTTWVQEITWLICNNADIGTAQEVDLKSRSRFIEHSEPGMEKTNVEILENTPPPRIIKTHFVPQFYQFCGNEVKKIFVMRNLKDVLVSSFHFTKEIARFPGNWEDFFEIFKRDEMFYGSWVKHCLKCWELRDDPNVLILKYEDMKQDHLGAIRKIAGFCGKTLSEEELNMVSEFSDFGNMKKRNDSSEKTKYFPGYKVFVRKGIVGEWKEWFTDEQRQYVDELVRTTTERQGLILCD